MKIKPKIPQLTVICVAGNKQGESIAAMYKTMKEIDAARYVLLTNIDITATGIDVINVGGLASWDDYNFFIIKRLYEYFDTTHCLIQQHDGYAINGDCWQDEFLKYDLIGGRGISDGRNNFNGGFSLRSKAFQEAIAKDDFISITAPEDEILCRLYRKHIEETYGFTYCTDEIADKFSFELHAPIQHTFGFHAYHWKPFQETVVIKRSCGLGDLIMAEPVLHYFHQQGFHVAIDTMQEFEGVYSQHYFPVYLKRMLNSKLKYREINLDFAYEIKPQQPVLQSYFEMAGIKDVPLRNSRLNMFAGENQKFFKKYVVINIDTTHMAYRDSFGINWKAVVLYLEEKGYLVFQIGRRIEKEVAPIFNTMSLEFMMVFVKGADLFIGHDSGAAQVAVGFDVPSVIFFGSVNPLLRYNNFNRIRVVQSECPSEEHKNCYHKQVDVVGKECFYDKELPPCTQYTATQVINAIKELI